MISQKHLLEAVSCMVEIDEIGTKNEPKRDEKKISTKPNGIFAIFVDFVNRFMKL